MKPVNELTKDEARAEILRLSLSTIKYEIDCANETLDKIENLADGVRNRIANIQESYTRLLSDMDVTSETT